MLEEVAKRWVPGEGPVEIEALASGLVNRSFRVTRAGRQFSLRLAAADTRLGLDRDWECRIRGPAAAAGLAAPVRHCDPVAGILVAEWTTGRCWTVAEILEPNNLDVMAQLLRRVHSLAIPEPARLVSPAQWVVQYAAAVGPGGTAVRAGSETLAAAAAVRVAALGPALRRALCHSDLHRFNVVIGDRPRLLDWEYAHVSEPLWDLAGWIANNDLSADAAEHFLASYLEGRVGSQDSSRLAHLTWLYDYVCVLWSDWYVQQRPGPESEAIRTRAAMLTMRLQRASGGRDG